MKRKLLTALLALALLASAYTAYACLATRGMRVYLMGTGLGAVLAGSWQFTLLAAVILWRCLSKNLAKRRAENARFLAWWRPKRARLTAARARRKDRDHRYFPCKSCGAVCRVPAGKGHIEITCPKCGNTLRVKS